MINISKYHGLGNDFILCNYEDVGSYDLSKVSKDLCNRKTGIGADGLIAVKTNPLEMIYYNSDGSRAEMCGNGIRCFSKYVYDHKIESNQSYEVVTLAGVMRINVLNTNPFLVEVNMGKESYTPSSIGLNQDSEMQNQSIELNNQTITISSLLMGVPHTTVEVDELNTEDMKHIGALLETNPLFKFGTNVNFYKLEDTSNITMQTFERGAGLTLACGTGACATFAQLHRENKVQSSCNVHLPLGTLNIRKENDETYMSGPAAFIFEGVVDEEERLW